MPLNNHILTFALESIIFIGFHVHLMKWYSNSRKNVLWHILSVSRKLHKSQNQSKVSNYMKSYSHQVDTPPNLGIADNKIRSLALGLGVWNPTFDVWLQSQDIKYFDQSL